MTSHRRRQVLLIDDNRAIGADFEPCLFRQADVHCIPACEAIKGIPAGISLVLLDVRTLLDLSDEQCSKILQQPGHRFAFITDMELDAYLPLCRRWGIIQCFSKANPINSDELQYFLESIEQPATAFGLHRFLTHTMEMYNHSISTIPEKNQVVEKVINHFATAGFEIHGLFDVRLVLEEALNNAFYHAFLLPNGQEKYHIQNFPGLDPSERIRVEYGNSGELCGLSVTDNSGMLRLETIIKKLERQYHKDSVMDSGGRGLYLSRMLSTNFVINIEEGKRTQIVATFDGRRSLPRPRSFIVNYIGEERVSQWRPDSDLD